MTTNTVLHGHTNFDNAYLIEDYPYSFSLRCQKKIWVEKATKGQAKGQYRVASCTSNPRKGDIWNKPKYSTYNDFKILYIDGNTGYVESTGCDLYNAKKFLEVWGEQLTDEQRDRLHKLSQVADAINARYKNAKWVIEGSEPVNILSL